MRPILGKDAFQAVETATSNAYSLAYSQEWTKRARHPLGQEKLQVLDLAGRNWQGISSDGDEGVDPRGLQNAQTLFS